MKAPALQTSTMTRKEYLGFYSQYDWDTFTPECPGNMTFAMDRLLTTFPDYEGFINEVDFQMLELPLHPEDYTELDWQNLADWADDYYTPHNRNEYPNL